MGEHHRSGGNRWCSRAAPCRTSYGGALGEASGAVSFHLREQGRPQGASFSAGDLSLHPRDQSPAEPRSCISLVARAGRRMHRQQPHRGNAGANRTPRTILRRIRKSDTDFRRLASDDDGRRRPHCLARDAQGACRGSAAMSPLSGSGAMFQLWDPARYEEHRAAVRERSRRQGTTLPPRGGAARHAAGGGA